MKPFLTTITPIWGERMKCFETWAVNLIAAHAPGVRHMILLPKGEKVPFFGTHFDIVRYGKPDDSIGTFHNAGVEMCNSEWVMKLDADAMANRHYFVELLPILDKARQREWFNGGMLYLNTMASHAHLEDPLTDEVFRNVMEHARVYSGFGGVPAGSNFICRRQDYLEMGGCDNRFRGWGWEDYQQTFALEAQFQGRYPLPAGVNQDNASRLCRDHITFRKALELSRRSPWLCLLHRWHTPASKISSAANRQVLYNHIKNYETNANRNRSSVSGQAQKVEVLGCSNS